MQQALKALLCYAASTYIAYDTWRGFQTGVVIGLYRRARRAETPAWFWYTMGVNIVAVVAGIAFGTWCLRGEL